MRSSNSAELRFLPAGEEDAHAIFTLAMELIDRYEDYALIGRDEVAAWMERKIRLRIGEYTRLVLGGETAGYYRAARAADGSLELDDLYLYPAFQGRGIGTEVLEKSIAEADAPIFLYVFRANTRAIRLYERLGFRVTEEVSPTRCIMRRA